MQEMIELSKQQTEEMPETPAKIVTFLDSDGREVRYTAGPAQFGKLIEDGYTVRRGKILFSQNIENQSFFLLQLTGTLVKTDPLTSCTELSNAKDLKGKIALVKRGDCMFIGREMKIIFHRNRHLLI